MDLEAFAVEAEMEATHWWFVGRRRLFARILERTVASRDARLLDLGTSTGTNLRLLKQLGYRDVTGLDANPEAVRYCASKGLGQVKLGDACALPFPDASFDFVFATDVIEHVDDDGKALSEVWRVLKPGGAALVTVPAFPSLWGLQDEVAHHKRRYRLAPLRRLVAQTGFDIRHSHYFNYLLFAPIWLARQVIGLLGLKLDSENQVNTPLMNRVLGMVFEIDTRTAPFIRPPFGVSALIEARKPGV